MGANMTTIMMTDDDVVDAGGNDFLFCSSR